MPFDGSGSYSRIHSWVSDRNASIKILADRHDEEDDGFATGLTNALCKDGQSTTSARIPFAVGLSVNAGSAGTPSISIIGDPNTGIYSTGSDAVAVSCGATKILEITTSGISVTGTIASSGGTSGALTITSNSANALAVGANGTTNPVLQINAATASVATGVKVTGAAAAGRAALAVISSGTDEGLSVDAKGAGTIRLGATSTGAVEFSRNAVPTSSDGAALGTSSLMWSDAFFASGAVLNFNNGNLTLTHSSGSLANSGAYTGTTISLTNAAAGATSFAANGVAAKLTIDFNGGGQSFHDASAHNFRTFAGTVGFKVEPGSGQVTISNGGASGFNQVIMTNDAAKTYQFGLAGSSATNANKFFIYGSVFGFTLTCDDNGQYSFLATTDSTSTTTGAAIFAGGVGISKALNIGGAFSGTSTNANALAVGRQGSTNPVLQVDASTASVATGIKIKGAAAAGGVALSVISSGAAENLAIDALGTGTITLGGTSTGGITISRALTYGGVTLSNAVTGTGNMVLSAGPTFTGTVTAASVSMSAAMTYGGVTLSNSVTGTGSMVLSAGPTFTGTLNSADHVITSSSANALAVGRLGSTTPALQIDASTGTSITGVKVKSAASGGGVAVSAIGETNVNLTIDANGSGTITLGGTSTGAITLTRATTMSNALTYGGVTLSNSVTGTGSMALSAGPTFTGTMNAATIAASTSITVNSSSVLVAGKTSLWVPAAAMKPRITNGAAQNTIELTTNKNIVNTLDFDATTQEFAQFDVRMPKSWNESTVTFIPVWSHPATASNFGVVWGLDAVAVSDNDAMDVAFGTAQTSTDTGGTTNNSYQGPESSAITIAGTPAENDLVMFRIHRDPANGSDTMAVDARLHGVLLFYTTNAANDA